MVVTGTAAAHGEVLGNKHIPGRIVSALGFPFRDCSKYDGTLVGTRSRRGIGEKIPIPLLRQERADCEPSINSPMYRHCLSFLSMDELDFSYLQSRKPPRGLSTFR